MSQVIIKGSKNIKEHFVGSQRVKEFVNDAGEIEREERTNFQGTRYPGTTQVKRIHWSDKQKKWLIDLTEEELNAFVKQCSLKYTEGAKMGQIIETANIRNEYDPFFVHKQLHVMLKEGMAILESEHPKDQVLIKGLEQDPTVSSKFGPQAQNVRLIITNTEKDKGEEFKDINTELEAIVAYGNLSLARKIAIATALGLPVNDNTPQDILNKLVMNLIKANVRNESGKTAREVLMKLINDTPENIEIKSLISRAEKFSIIRNKKGEGYFYKGEIIASNMKNLESYLKNINNKDVLEAIINGIKEKS